MFTVDDVALFGTGRLTRFALRRDRIRILMWTIVIGGFITYSAAGLSVSYPDAASLQARAKLMTNPSMAFMAGPGYGVDKHTFGAVLANELLSVLAVVAALMSVFLVVSHTRGLSTESYGPLLGGREGRRALPSGGFRLFLGEDVAWLVHLRQSRGSVR